MKQERRVADGEHARVASAASWTVEIRRPTAAPSIVVAGTCLSDAGFPTAAIGASVDLVARALMQDPGTRIGIYSHVAASGDAARDKLESDLRGRALRVVLEADEAGFEVLAAEGGWSTAEDQAMLRALGCNPAAIDGEAGPCTEAATRMFQEEWNLGWHHPDGVAELLALSGSLDATTRKALRRAYLLLISGQLAADQFHGAPWSGCSGFAPAADPETSTRGVIVLYRDRRPTTFPCREGDPSACRVDDIEAVRCRFYRTVTTEPARSDPPIFFDFEWMPLASGKVNLSVLTSLPEGARPTFEVFRHVHDYDGRVRRGDAASSERGELIATVPGIVRLGVAVAMFEPPEGWSPFDISDWYADLEEREDDPSGSFRPPIFRIHATPADAWADSTAPGRRLDRIPVDDARGGGVALTNDGRSIEFWFDQTLAWPGERRRADEHLRVIAWQTPGSGFADDGGEL